MFLDDELLEICKNYKIESSEDVQKLYLNINKKCEIYYKEKIKSSMKVSEVKAIVDRTFKLFDSFVEQLEKDESNTMNIIAKLFKEHSFKNNFMKHKELRNIYNRL